MSDTRPGLIQRLVDLGRAAATSILPAAGAVALAPRADAAPGSPAPLVERADCAPNFCGSGGVSTDSLLRLVWSGYVGLDRDTLDVLAVDQLMHRIIVQIVQDMLKDKPKMSGEQLGELSDVVDWLWARGANEALESATIYARHYGGGGIVCFVSDGRPAHEPIDPMGNWGLEGLYALPKWYLTPTGIGSPRAGQAWYGPRIGRPEHYIVTPENSGGTLPTDLGPMLRRSGSVFHRSRVVPFMFRPELDFRLARRFPNWNGWGPGVVEAVASPYLLRKAGMMRTDDIMNSVVVNVLTMDGVANALSTPTGGAALRKVLEFIKACRDWTAGQGVPLIAIDGKSKLESLSHTLAGLSDLLKAQRQFLLDNLEYTEISLFGSSSSGLSGDDMKGEWQGYYQRAETLRDTWIWRNGAFGGGLRQLAALAMLCRNGPTRGRLDPTAKATWPPLWTESNKDRSEARLKDAQARALDKANVGLTPEAMLRHDPTVQASYPSLDVDEEPLPTLQTGALAPASAGPGESAITPAQATAQNVGGGAAAPTDAAPGQPPAEFPPDLMTAAQARRALKIGNAPLRRWVADGKVREYLVPVGDGRFSRRYRQSQLVEAALGGGAPTT